MSNIPLPDMVVDVIRAADPKAYQTSVEKLRQAQHALPAKVQNFHKILTHEKTMAEPKNISTLYSENENKVQNLETIFSPTRDVKVVPKEDAKHQAYKNFEALMLQNFVKNMFTTDTQSVFGNGQSGKIWKSMMVEAMSKEMAEAGGIGIAKMLEHNQMIKDKET